MFRSYRIVCFVIPIFILLLTACGYEDPREFFSENPAAGQSKAEENTDASNDADASADNESPTATVSTVNIDQSNLDLVVAEEVRLTATVTTTGDADDANTWSSGDPNVASITNDGVLGAVNVGSTTITATSVADSTKSDTITVGVAARGALTWTQQFGSASGNDIQAGIALDGSGNIYVAGHTDGAFAGHSNTGPAGEYDVYVRAHDSDGNGLWTQQFGSPDGGDQDDRANGIAADADGNSYVVGFTDGNLTGTNLGGIDAFVRSYDSNGVVLWEDQFGTTLGDRADAVAYANNTIYVGGHTKGDLAGNISSITAYDSYIRSYARDGTLRWTRQFGTAESDELRALTTDANGNVYAAGITGGTFSDGGAEAGLGSVSGYVRSYDSDGNHRWTQQFGTSNFDQARAVAADAQGNVYVAGDTDLMTLDRGAPFVRSYDVDGNLRWMDDFGSDQTDQVFAISTTEDGTVTIAGSTYGSLEGFTNEGSADVFMGSYSRDGTPGPLKQFGTNGPDFVRGIVTGANGSRYLVGKTDGDLTGEGAVGKAYIRSYGRP